LAHGTRTGTQLAFIKIEHEGIVAYGEASLPPYLPETFESVKTWVEKQRESVTHLLNSNPFENQADIPFSKENTAASAALQSAILNWFVTANDQNLTDYFTQTETQPDLAITVTKDDFDFIEEKLVLAKNFTHLKLKLTGHDDDLEFVKAILKKTDLPFCVDANQGFHKKENAIKVISQLELLNCVLVEQPLNAQDHEGHYWLKQRVKTPIIADESIRVFEDLVQYHEAYSGVNIKLMKCGGLFQAQKLLGYKANGEPYIKLIGCMTESSLGVSTSAVLASQSVMADLDAPYLIKNDPFQGFQIKEGEIKSTDKISLKAAYNF
jgi:L-alanine-DL-glutamate epimerase-like enolase superfamily enzyme